MLKVIDAEFIGKSVPIDNNQGMCMYRGPNGKKCAAGLFIPDSLYKKTMEGSNIEAVLKLYPKIEKKMPLNKYGMYIFQLWHDRYLSTENTTKEQKAKLMEFIKKNVK